MRTQHLFGLDFATDTSVDDVAELLHQQGLTPSASWRILVTPNVDHVVRYDKSPRDRAVAEAATWVLPDGAPIVWASRLLGAPLSSRLPGSTLFSVWWSRMVDAERPIFVVASSQRLVEALVAEYPAANCIVAPMFDADDDMAVEALATEMLREIERSSPDAVLLCLSMTKQHALVGHLLQHAVPRAPLLMLLGASAEFHVGLQNRAPEWMQRHGLEWLHRLLSDPRRLAKRYLVDDLAFAPIVWREWRSKRST